MARQVRRGMAILRSFGAIERPEAWLLAPDGATLTLQGFGLGRTEHPFGAVATVEIQAEKLGEERK